MKTPAIPQILAFSLCLLPHGQIFAGAYVDEENRLVVNGVVIAPPAFSVDLSSGAITVKGQVLQIPHFTLLEDGSLLFEGVLYPVPGLPIAGAASYGKWLEIVFPNPADREDPEIAGPMADPGNLGVPNLIRYALAMHSSAGIFESMPRGLLNEGQLGLSFPFIGVRPDVRIEVVASSDLVDWTEVLWDSFVDGPAEEAETWVSVKDGISGGAARGTRFLRLRFSQPPPD